MIVQGIGKMTITTLRNVSISLIAFAGSMLGIGCSNQQAAGGGTTSETQNAEALSVALPSNVAEGQAISEWHFLGKAAPDPRSIEDYSTSYTLRLDSALRPDLSQATYWSFKSASGGANYRPLTSLKATIEKAHYDNSTQSITLNMVVIDTLNGKPVEFTFATELYTGAFTAMDKGRTWISSIYSVIHNISYLSCNGKTKEDGSCGETGGNTSCAQALPLLCRVSPNPNRPLYALAPNDSIGEHPPEYSQGWGMYNYALTPPYYGDEILTPNVGDELCRVYLGKLSQWATPTDSRWVEGMGTGWPVPEEFALQNIQKGGWGMHLSWVEGETDTLGGPYWINQPGSNCYE